MGISVEHPQSGYSSTFSRLNWNLEVLVLVEGGKAEYPEKTLEAGTRTKNKLNPHLASTRESNTGQIGERRVLSPLRHSSSLESEIATK